MTHLPQNPGLAVEQMLLTAQNLTHASGSDSIRAILIAVVEAGVGPLDTSIILDAITQATGIKMKVLKGELKDIQLKLKMLLPDPALILTRITLDSMYPGGTVKRSADGAYWVYDKTHWRETTEGQVRNNLLTTATNHPELVERSLSALVSSAKTCLDDFLGTDEDVFGIATEPLPVVNALNGEVWIKPDGTVELRPHRPESGLTYCLAVSYDPMALCPRYDDALTEIFAKTASPVEMAQHWNELLGYAIQPMRDIASFWLLVGHGSNGKSKLLATMQKLIGPHAVLNLQISSFQRDRFNMAALAGKLVLIDDDLSEGTVLDDGLIKKISEGKDVTSRHAYGRRNFNFRSLVLPIMAGNSYPRTVDVSHGMLRRANVIPFDRVFGEDADPSLFPAIWEAEMPGVLNRALEGLARLRQRGAFAPPQECLRAVLEFMTHANPLMAFLEAECKYEPEGRVRLDVFRARMAEWAKVQGVKRPPTDKTLKRKLLGLDIKVSKVKGYETVFGLAWV